jgi:glucose-6-phosphate 1-dehydrogenase
MSTHPVDLGFADQEVFGGDHLEDYERLLADAMEGNPAHFAREDGVEEAWRIVAPLLEHPGPVHPYEPGSWGPAEADRLAGGERSWHNPS